MYNWFATHTRIIMPSYLCSFQTRYFFVKLRWQTSGIFFPPSLPASSSERLFSATETNNQPNNNNKTQNSNHKLLDPIHLNNRDLVPISVSNIFRLHFTHCHYKPLFYSALFRAVDCWKIKTVGGLLWTSLFLLLIWQTMHKNDSQTPNGAH